ncbi:YifB family Mg chelatase-like AAA ATPase [Streptomyces microflavus]|uniref:YifB family Mg chelatase-like AAA ATPase n=1 Tax=Streptomyces microflavus TaxID=1919 RepID=UPI0036AC3A7E
MGYARACSVALVGVEGVVVEVQADLEPGVAAFTLVGLPDKSLIESRDRVRAAVVNSGAEWPQKKLTVGLSPASVPKSGSGFDLAVACAVLGAAERIDPASIADVVMIGELGLDGRVRPVRGVLPAVLAAAEAGYQQVVVPEQTAGEAALVPGVSVLGVRSLRQLIAVLCDEPVPDEPADDRGRPDAMLAGLMIPGTGLGAGLAPASPRGEGHIPDLADVAGQLRPRKALEVAAAGGHHLLLSGPPGAGKTILAERLPAVLPPLTRRESLEVTAVHSVAGILPPGEPLVSRAPYCAPHHSATMQSLVGGGNGIPRPGAVSLAHRGVLFVRFSGRGPPWRGSNLRLNIADMFGMSGEMCRQSFGRVIHVALSWSEEWECSCLVRRGRRSARPSSLVTSSCQSRSRSAAQRRAADATGSVPMRRLCRRTRRSTPC